MGILNKSEIIRRMQQGQLITNARRDKKNGFHVEAASYDLSAGIVIWKEPAEYSKARPVKITRFDPHLPDSEQPTVTLLPGQMMFVITKEDVNMPKDLCGTVYSRNRLARDGILALNAGHIDPGYTGPIAIRLINLRSIPYTLILGTPIYTIVFHELFARKGDTFQSHDAITLEETVARYTHAMDEALGNAFLDPSMVQDFLRKEDFGNALWAWIKNHIVAAIVAFIIFMATVVAAIPTFVDLFKKTP